jgi:hypothetical protein
MIGRVSRAISGHATAAPPNRLTTQRRMLQRAGGDAHGWCSYARLDRYLAAILNGLTVAMLVLLIAAILVRNVGPTEKAGRATSDFGVADLRGSLP